jgi:predicted nucleotidyltransferase
MIALTDAERAIVEGILRTQAIDQPYSVVIFGSRASGKPKRYSDIDLALIGSHTIAPKVYSRLVEAFENSSLPYTVDIVDASKASMQLLDQIRQHGEELVQL